MNVGRPLQVLGGALVAGLGTAAIVARSAQAAERRHPPTGKIIDTRGVRLHYIERGTGNAVLLLHGNLVTAEDWVASGVFDRLAEHHRVIAFDRPGFGYSERPRTAHWSPDAQADLIHAALEQLGVGRCTVVAHSWATLVAIAMGLSYPHDVARLVLLSGYYYPSPRLDAMLANVPASPLLGDMLCATVQPVLGRALAPVWVRQLFAPAPVPERFSRVPLSMVLRPSQVRATVEEGASLVSSAALLEPRYHEIALPISVMAGEGDRVVAPAQQSLRFARAVSAPDVTVIPGAGHMVHYADPERVAAAVT